MRSVVIDDAVWYGHTPHGWQALRMPSCTTGHSCFAEGKMFCLAHFLGLPDPAALSKEMPSAKQPLSSAGHSAKVDRRQNFPLPKAKNLANFGRRQRWPA
jgi:hypothetical protein